MPSLLLFSRLLLIFALLFAQMGGLIHGISHTRSQQEQNSDQSLPEAKHCDQCSAYGQIGSALGSSSAGFTAREYREAVHAVPSATHRYSAFAAYTARAPPHSA